MCDMEKNPKHVVVVGAGFGGVYTVRNLLSQARKGNIKITLISKHNYFLFTPLLHEVATGGLSAHSVSESLREIFRGEPVEIIEGDVVFLNEKERRVELKSGCSIPFDFVVMSTGSETAFYRTPGAQEFALSLKSVRDAVNIRNKIIDAFEEAVIHKKKNNSDKPVSFVVVGGGPTGIEIATEIAEFVHTTLLPYYAKNGLDTDDVSVHLISKNDILMSESSVKIQRACLSALHKMKIVAHTGSSVSSVTFDGVNTDRDGFIHSSLTIWAAGVTPLQVPEKNTSGPVNVVVDPYLRKAGSENVYALGDCVSGVIDGRAMPRLAQAATAEAGIVAKNIIAQIKNKKLTSFAYKSKGTLLSLGQWNATGSIFGLYIGGMFAWWVWRTIYLSKFISWRKRFRIALEWTINIFYPRDISRI